MLIHFVQPQFSDEYDDYDYDNYKVINAFTVKDYHRFIKFIQAMKGHEVDLDGTWYTIETYVFKLPKDSDSLPCLMIYVEEYMG